MFSKAKPSTRIQKCALVKQKIQFKHVFVDTKSFNHVKAMLASFRALRIQAVAFGSSVNQPCNSEWRAAADGVMLLNEMLALICHQFN